MYAIRNKRSGRWLYGTNYCYFPRRQRTSHDRALIFEDRESAELEFKVRSCGKDYEIIPVRLEALED